MGFLDKLKSKDAATDKKSLDSGEKKRNLSVRSKISFGYILTIVLVLPVIILSLHYLNIIQDEITELTQTDIEVSNIIEDIKTNVLELEETEKFFRLLQDTTYYERNKTIALQLKVKVETGAKLKYKREFEEISLKIDEYEDNFRLKAAEILSEIKRKKEKTLRREVSSKINSYLETYKDLIQKTYKEKDPVIRDSLIRYANDYLTGFAAELYQSNTGKGEIKFSTIPGQIIKMLDALAKSNRQSINNHYLSSTSLVSKAARNIYTVIFFVVIILIYLIIFYPKYVVRNIILLTNVIKRIKDGDIDIIAKNLPNDETGELALYLNDTIKNLRLIDKLKTEKILNQFNKFKATLNAIEDIVIITDDKLRITTVNTAFCDFFNIENVENILNQEIKIIESKINLYDRVIKVKDNLKKAFIEDKKIKREVISKETGQKHTEQSYKFNVHILPIQRQANELYAISIIMTYHNE